MLYLKDVNRIKYHRVANMSITNIVDGDFDLNVFIPKFGRDMFLLPCLKYFHHAIQRVNLKVRMVVIEHDMNPKSQSICKHNNISYIFIPGKSIPVFNKALCYNMGFLLVPSTEWSLYHDIDILPPEDFFVHLHRAMETTDKNWIQPYSKKSVCYLNNAVTNHIFKSTEIIDIRKFKDGQDYRRGMPGAPGGSICIPNIVFQKVGGYDPEVFSNYSPEDEMLWRKLESFSDDGHKTNEGVHCHSGRMAEYLEQINLYHLHHLPSRPKNNIDSIQQRGFVSDFVNLSFDQKREFLRLCESLLQL